MPKYPVTTSVPMVTRRLYRYGSLGDHSRAFGTGIRRWVPTVPVTEPTGVSPMSTSARTCCPALPRTTRSSTPAGTSGVVSSRVMCLVATGSSHTVCQMPDAAVYQMPVGSRRCLPIGNRLPSIGECAPTMISLAPARSALVMSNENASKPPVCVPTGVPFTHTRVSQVTAPKFSSTRRPSQVDGTVNVLR
jgi:hypothetical protein